MTTRTLFLSGVAAMTLLSPTVRTQEPGYPVELIKPGKGPFEFPQGYQTPVGETVERGRQGRAATPGATIRADSVASCTSSMVTPGASSTR